MTFQEKLFTLRKKNGLSQEELAQELGVTRQAVYKWESGNSSPEIDKIRAIARLFGVSFDYLLNDDVEDFEPDMKDDMHKVTYRKVFLRGDRQLQTQADIDHGYTIERPKNERTGMSTSYFKMKRKAAEDTIREAGASEIVFVSPRENIAFFYDDKRKVIGFYYGYAIQIICPIENISGFTFHGGGANVINSKSPIIGLGTGGIGIGSVPTTMVLGNMPIAASLIYHDGDDIKELTLSFDTILLYLANDCDGNLEAAQLIQNVTKENILENLGRIGLKIDALRDSSALLVRSDISDIDVEHYLSVNTKAEQEYRAYRERVVNEIRGITVTEVRPNKAPDPEQRVEERPPTDEDVMYKIGKVVLLCLVVPFLILLLSIDTSLLSFFIIFIPILLGLIPSYIAQSKGREAIVWWIYGTFLFIIALIHSLIITDERK